MKQELDRQYKSICCEVRSVRGQVQFVGMRRRIRILINAPVCVEKQGDEMGREFD